MSEPLVVFIGPPGSGKSRIGKTVAKRLVAEFIDTDKRIVAAHGPIPAIFAEHGEGVFREWERNVVAASLHERAVVSLGGGAVLDPDTQAQLQPLRVVQLTVTLEAIRPRLTISKRPLLAGGIDDWERIARERAPIYDRLADRTWDTSTRPAALIADEIAEWVRQHERTP